MRFVLLLLIACGEPPVEPIPSKPAKATPTGATGQQAPEDEEIVTETPQEQPAARFRVVAANLSSGGQQSYDEGSGARILRSLQPDIVLLQEFNYSAGVREFVDQTFGAEFEYARESSYSLPNGVISRFPIKDSGSWDDPLSPNRGFAWARIDIPGPVDLWAISVHLLTADPDTRDAEARALVALLDENVPAGDYLVLGGDFNTRSRTEPCLQTLSSWFKTAGPYPADKNGQTNTNAARKEPYDWVLSSSLFAGYEKPVEFNGSMYENGYVADTRVEFVEPAMAADSDAENMQHMAVVKDYAVLP